MNSRQPIFPMIGSDPFNPADQWAREHGLTAEDVAQMGMRYVGYDGSRQMIGLPIKEGVHIPYPKEDYSGRVRNLTDKGPKYLCRLDSGCPPPYWSPNVFWDSILTDVSLPLAIVEGEVEAFCSNKFSNGANVSFLGIGGVDTISTLFDRGIVWKGRTVYVGFDKDVGYETGEYKPTVSHSLGRLAHELVCRGAAVKILNVPGKKTEKLGVGDYLRAGGSWNVLEQGATSPPEWCEPLAWLLENCVYVTGTDHTHVYNLEDGSRKSVKDFHDAHIEKTRPVPKDGGGVRIEQLSSVWQRHKSRLTAKGYSLNPMLPFGLSGRDINLWRPFPTFEGELVPAVTIEWQKFMEGLFGEHWHWVGAWVGHMLNRPEEKPHQAVLLTTRVGGIGKSLFSEIVKKLVGLHGLECKPEEMFDRFNKEMEGATWIAVNEVDVSFSSKEGQVNNLITSEQYKIEGKGRDATYLPDLRRWYLTTNSASPMRLSKEQRRILVIFPPRTLEDTHGPWGQWVGSEIASYKRDSSALCTIREWFDHALSSWEKENGRWNPTAPVPKTDAGEELAEASMTSNQVLAASAISWMREHGDIGAISQDQKKLMAKVFGDIGALVKAGGGNILKWKFSEDGVQKEFTVWDLTGKLPRTKLTNGGYAPDKTSGKFDDINPSELGKMLWQVLFNLSERQKGHVPIKGQD